MSLMLVKDGSEHLDGINQSGKEGALYMPDMRTRACVNARVEGCAARWMGDVMQAMSGSSGRFAARSSSLALHCKTYIKHCRIDRAHDMHRVDGVQI